MRNWCLISLIVIFADICIAKSNKSAGNIQQTTITEIEVPRFKKRWTPWSLSYFNWSTQNLAKTEEGTARLSSYNYLSVNYRLKDALLSVRPTFFISGAGYDEFERGIVKSEFELGDIYLQYSKYNVLLLPGDIGLTGALRLYLPQGEYAKRQGKVTELRGKFYFSKPWGYGWHTTYMIEPRFYFYKERGYLSEFGTSLANRYGLIWHYLEQTNFFNQRYGFSAQAGMKHQYYYDFESEGIRNKIKDHFEIGTYFLLNLHGVRIRAGVMQSHNVRRPNGKYEPGGKYKVFNPEETQLSLMTSFRL